MSNRIIEKDVAIIGAGPVGLFTVFEMGFMGYTCAVIDSLSQTGGQLTELYPEKPIYDIPGFPSVDAGQLIKNLEQQIAPYKPEYILGDAVSELTKNGDTFTLTAGDTTVKAKVVVIAAGNGVFTPRKATVANLAQFEGKSVFYAVKNKAALAGKNIVIAGGGDSAVDWAVELAENAAHVHVVHRRGEFRAAEDTVRKMNELVAAGKITLHAPAQLQELVGANGKLSQVLLTANGEQIAINADVMLCFYGLLPSLGNMGEWGLELEQKRFKVTPSTMQTNVDGVLAVGDITIYEGKIALILTGFAEAAIAAKTAQSIINPDKKYKLKFTTSSGIDGF